MKKRIITSLFVCLQANLILACGLYQVPLAPEFFAPMEVNELLVTTEDQKITLAWSASKEDRRKEKLKFIDGYRIERKGPIKDTIQKTDLEYQELKFIPDQHLEIEKKLKDEAIEKGAISRKVKAEEQYYSFKFEDINLEKNSTYFYKITPINQGNVKGQVKQVVVVEFNGIDSRVILIEPKIEDLQ